MSEYHDGTRLSENGDVSGNDEKVKIEDQIGEPGGVQLEFSEVLNLLSRKAVLGVGIPTKYEHPPWSVPETHPQHQLVSSILQFSMKVQSGSVPGSDEFQNFILSNSSLAVSGLLQYYLSLLDIKSEVIFGVLQWDESARSGPDDYQGTPHVWLDVDDFPVDNTHVAFPPDADNLAYFFECKKLNSFLRINPLETEMKLFLGQKEDDESSTREILMHNLKIMRTYTFPNHLKKYLAVSLKHCELNPGVKLYHILMGKFLKPHLPELTHNQLEEEMAKKCWACGKLWQESDRLKTCTACKTAKYCDRDCQRTEWKVHKLLHQELEHTKKLLEENEAEENPSE